MGRGPSAEDAQMRGAIFIGSVFYLLYDPQFNRWDDEANK